HGARGAGGETVAGDRGLRRGADVSPPRRWARPGAGAPAARGGAARVSIHRHEGLDPGRRGGWRGGGGGRGRRGPAAGRRGGRGVKGGGGGGRGLGLVAGGAAGAMPVAGPPRRR